MSLSIFGMLSIINVNEVNSGLNYILHISMHIFNKHMNCEESHPLAFATSPGEDMYPEGVNYSGVGVWVCE